MMGIYASEFFIVAIPVMAVLFLIVSIIRYSEAKLKNRKKPGSYSDKEVKKRLLWVIISLLIIVAMVISAIAIIIELEKSMTYM